MIIDSGRKQTFASFAGRFQVAILNLAPQGRETLGTNLKNAPGPVALRVSYKYYQVGPCHGKRYAEDMSFLIKANYRDCAY